MSSMLRFIKAIIKILVKSEFEDLNAHKSVVIPSNCVVKGNVDVEAYSTFGPGCFFRGDISIGRYCQFGASVSVHSRTHSMNSMTTYNNPILFDGELKKLSTSKKVSIGHDVWVGHGAIILSGVSIGNGVVIGAGSVVTKSVEDFSVVAGVPAKEIKKRFTKDTREAILELKWWEKTPEELKKIKDLFFKDLSKEELI